MGGLAALALLAFAPASVAAGRSWRVAASYRKLSLSNVWCLRGGSCMASGSISMQRSGLAEVDAWDGVGWSAQPLAQPAVVDHSYLDDVSCARSICVSVGSYGVRHKPYDAYLLAERLSDGRWVRLFAPSPGVDRSFRYASLTSVSCTSAQHCTAVGSVGPLGSLGVPLVERFDGSSWKVQRVSLPARITGAEDYRGAGLGSISCPAVSACMAVGFYETFTTNGRVTTTFVEGWNGHNWSFTALPSHNEVSSGPVSVSCTSATACTVVGTFDNADPWTPQPGPPPQAFAERWNGTSWSAQTLSSPLGAQETALSAVSCPGAQTCIAVGWSKGSTTGSVHTLVERWDGISWSVEPSPDPRGLPDPLLVSVSCNNARTCTATGDYNGVGSFIERRY
jgi:hypothetical protein